MKATLITFICAAFSLTGFAQNKLLSYEDIKYLLHNNLAKADTFLLAKGYAQQTVKSPGKNRKFLLTLPSDTHNEVDMRSDGKKIFISIQTNTIEQYNLLKNSIASYKVSSAMGPDSEAYDIKNLGNIYIIVGDNNADPLKKDYDIQIVPNKNIAAVD